MRILIQPILAALLTITASAEGLPEFTAAMDLYQAGRWSEARAKFIEANDLSPLAAFYEMECLRRAGDLDGLATALQKFGTTALPCEYQTRQVAIDQLWDAVRTKDWERLEKLVAEWVGTRLPGDQRAQVAYCHGLALEGLKRPEEALFAYQTALTADSGAPVEIVRQAALRILAIHKEDPEVLAALKASGTPSEDKNSRAFLNLKEAAGVANLFQLSLGGGAPLPPEFRDFLTFKPTR